MKEPATNLREDLNYEKDWYEAYVDSLTLKGFWNDYSACAHLNDLLQSTRP